MVIVERRVLICLIHNLDNRHLTVPTGAAFISAVLKHELFNVRNFLWDLAKDDATNTERLKEALSRYDIDVLMCGGMVFDYRILERIFLTTKALSQSIITIQGGCFVSYSPVESMKLLADCDIGVLGEGEITACELMSAIQDGKDISIVKGIVFRDAAGGLRFTDKRVEKPDLSALPIPDAEGFFGDWLKSHEAYMVTSGRNCNHACTFCTKFDSRYRERPLEKVFEELDYYLLKYKIKGVRILNEYFSVEESYISAFCEGIRRFNLPVTIQTRISQALTLEVLKKLKESGVVAIAFGIESADDTVLRSMKKGVTTEMMLKVLRDVKAAGIVSIGSFIFGDPAESRETVQRTLDFAKEHRDLLNNNNVSFQMIRLCPGSALYDKAVSKGKLDPMTHIKNLCPPVNISRLSDEEYAYYNDYYFINFLTNHIETDLNIDSVKVDRTAEPGSCLFKYRCVSCGKQHELRVEYRKIRLVDCKFFCGCGEALALDFIYHLLDKEHILDTVSSLRTAFYGLGRIFYKLYSKCGLSELQDNEYYLVDRGLALAWSAGNKQLKVYPPESIGELGVEKVIVTISGEYDLDKIVTDLRLRYPKTEFTMWFDSFSMGAEKK